MSEAGRLLVAAPSAPLDLVPAGATPPWVFLGPHARVRLELEAGALRAHRRISIGERFQAAFRELAPSYIEWVGELGRERDSLAWWAGSIADRWSSSTLLQNICYLRVGLELAAERGAEGILLVAESAAVRSTLAADARPAPSRSLPGARRQARFFAGRALELGAATLLRKAASRPTRPEIVLVTYVDDEALGPAGELRDRYFGALPAFLRERGHDVSWIPLRHEWTKGRVELLRRARASAERLLVPADWQRLGDFVEALASVKRCYPPGERERSFAGLPVGALLAEEERAIAANLGVVENVCLHRFVERLSLAGRDIRAFVYPYENLSWEKVFCHAVRRFLPRAELVGFQHTTLGPSLLNYFPSRFEWEANVLPHRVVCAGETFRDLLLANGYPAERVAVGVSLRDTTVGALARAPWPSREPSRRVLVSMPFSEEETAELLHATVAAFAASDVEVWLKPHPAGVRPERFLSLLPGTAIPERFAIKKGKLEERLAEAAVLVYASGTAVYVALALGLPVVHLAPESLVDRGLIPGLDGSPGTAVVATPGELRARTLALLDLGPEERARHAAWGRSVAVRAFAPLTEAGLSAFLPRATGAGLG